MTTYTKKRLNKILEDIETNFSQVIDYIIYYDSVNEDENAWDLIYMIEELGHDKEIRLLLSDFESRDLTKGPTLLYNALLYGLVNNEASKELLVDTLKQDACTKFKTHLITLDKKKGRDGDLNIADVFKQLDQDSTNFDI